MKAKKNYKLFNRVLTLFLILGVGPTLLLTIVFNLPLDFQTKQYHMIMGMLLILSTISTLCLAGLITRILKHPLNQLLDAQRQVRHGNLEYRLPEEENEELQRLFDGFNKMAEEMSEAIQQKQRFAEQQSFTKLASKVIHDLRSPLSTLKVAYDVCSSQVSSNPQCTKCAELTKISLKRLEDITEELLTERKNLSSPSTILLHETIDELLMELALQEKYPSLIIQKNYHNVPLRISAEKNDLKRAFTNIITNAVEAMHGNGNLTITTAIDGNSVRIDIKDTGPGMSPDILEKVLQGGFTYGKANGNGIGMTVVRDVVEKYKGLLKVTSVVKMGTTFHISLPPANPISN